MSYLQTSPSIASGNGHGGDERPLPPRIVASHQQPRKQQQLQSQLDQQLQHQQNIQQKQEMQIPKNPPFLWRSHVSQQYQQQKDSYVHTYTQQHPNLTFQNVLRNSTQLQNQFQIAPLKEKTQVAAHNGYLYPHLSTNQWQQHFSSHQTLRVAPLIAIPPPPPPPPKHALLNPSCSPTSTDSGSKSNPNSLKTFIKQQPPPPPPPPPPPLPSNPPPPPPPLPPSYPIERTLPYNNDNKQRKNKPSKWDQAPKNISSGDHEKQQRHLQSMSDHIAHNRNTSSVDIEQSHRRNTIDPKDNSDEEGELIADNSSTLGYNNAMAALEEFKNRVHGKQTINRGRHTRQKKLPHKMDDAQKKTSLDPTIVTKCNAGHASSEMIDDNQLNKEEKSDVRRDDTHSIANRSQMEMLVESSSSELQKNTPSKKLDLFDNNSSSFSCHPEQYVTQSPGSPAPSSVSCSPNRAWPHNSVLGSATSKSRTTDTKSFLVVSPQKDEENRDIETLSTLWKSSLPPSPSSVHQDVGEFSKKPVLPSPAFPLEHFSKDVKKINPNSSWVHPKARTLQEIVCESKQNALKDEQHALMESLTLLTSNTMLLSSISSQAIREDSIRNNTKGKTSRWGKILPENNSQLKAISGSHDKETEENERSDSLKLEKENKEEISTKASNKPIQASEKKRITQNSKNFTSELAKKRARVLNSIKKAAEAKKRKIKLEDCMKNSQASKHPVNINGSLHDKHQLQQRQGDISRRSPNPVVPLANITALSQPLFINNISQSGPASKVRILEPSQHEHFALGRKVSVTNNTDKESPVPILEIEENKRQSDALRDKLVRLKKRLAAKVEQNKAKRVKLTYDASVFSQCATVVNERTTETSFSPKRLTSHLPTSCVSQSKSAECKSLASRNNDLGKEAVTTTVSTEVDNDKELSTKLLTNGDTKNQLSELQIRQKNISSDQINDFQQPQGEFLNNLKKRQRKLRNEIDLSKMKNIRTLHEELLTTHKSRLQKNASLLHDCIEETSSKKKSISESETHLKALEKKKLIMENMMGKVTRKLMDARKRLNDCKRKRAAQNELPSEVFTRSNSSKRGRASDFF